MQTPGCVLSAGSGLGWKLCKAGLSWAAAWSTSVWLELPYSMGASRQTSSLEAQNFRMGVGGKGGSRVAPGTLHKSPTSTFLPWPVSKDFFIICPWWKQQAPQIPGKAHRPRSQWGRARHYIDMCAYPKRKTFLFILFLLLEIDP